MVKEFVTERLKLIDLYPDKAKSVAEEYGLKEDEVELIRKGRVSSQPVIDRDARTVTNYISTDAIDRDNEVIEHRGVVLDDYVKNPIVPWAHNYHDLPIGKNLWIKPDRKGLVAKTYFAKHPFAEQVFDLYTEDVKGTGPVLKAWSVGFIPLKWKDAKNGDKDIPQGERSTEIRRTYKKWLLLEYSAVPVPSNPEALTLMMEKGLIKDKKLVKDIEEFITETKEEQIHDHTDKVLLGDEAVGETKEDKIDKTDKELALKPYPNEHACRINSPGKYDRIRRVTCGQKHDGKCIDVIYGVKDNKSEIQALRYKTKIWDVGAARNHCKTRDGAFEPASKAEAKERWNKSLPKLFDVSEVESPKPRPFNYDLYSKFLECKIKEIFKNTYSIPSPLMGTYLAGLKEILSRFDLKDTRNFNWEGVEKPPEYEVIQLNSTQSDDFLMSGISFYDADGTPLIVKYAPEWSGFNVSFITSTQCKEWNKELLDEIHKWVQDNNFLKGEKFSLSGEFLDKSEDGWDNLILKSEMKDVLRKSVNYLMKKKDNLPSRGLLFIGPPGTGKTKTGRVLMNKADATFIWVSSRDFRMVGPLRALTLSFSLARQLAPTILFIEDIDTWLKEYGNQDSVVVDLLKTELDGIKQNKGIINILTSNYPEKLPDTLLDRPGRFHHIVNFELPQAEQRKKMLVLWAGEIENDLLEKIVKEIEGFSGAHIRELVDYAYIIAEEDDTDIGKAIVKSLEKLREQRDLIAEIRENKKSLKQILEENEIITGKSKDKELREGYEKYDKIADENWARFAEEVQPQLIEKIESLEEEVKEIKEGRVLSGKNLKLVKDCREQMGKALELLDKLIVASEPPKEESILSLIDDNPKANGSNNDNKTDLDSLTKKDIPIIMEELLKALKEGMLGQRKEMQDLIDSKTGKIR